MRLLDSVNLNANLQRNGTFALVQAVKQTGELVHTITTRIAHVDSMVKKVCIRSRPEIAMYDMTCSGTVEENKGLAVVQGHPAVKNPGVFQ